MIEPCAYCNDTGWFYTHPDLGACGCGIGTMRLNERSLTMEKRNARYRKRLVEDVKKRLAALASEQPVRDDDTDVITCLVCCHFDEPNAACRQAPGYAQGLNSAKPPPRIIAFGCSNFLDIDDIPF